MESTKNRVICELTEARRGIVEATSTSLPGDRDEVFLGIWSLKDLIAHLIGWDYTNILSIDSIRRGEMPSCFTQWNPDWAAYNAGLVKTYKRCSWDEMLVEVKHSHHELLERLEQLPLVEFERDFGARSPRGTIITVARYLQGEIDDERKHCQQIQTWLKKQEA